MTEKIKLAALHYEKSTLKYHGLIPWCRYMTIQKQTLELARVMDNTFLTRRSFRQWLFQLLRKQSIVMEKSYAIQRQRYFQKYFRQWSEVR